MHYQKNTTNQKSETLNQEQYSMRTKLFTLLQENHQPGTLNQKL